MSEIFNGQLLNEFLLQGPFYETAGAVCPFSRFASEFVAWLATDELQMAWGQGHRIRNALLKAQFPIGRVGALGMRPDQLDHAYIGNLAGPLSRSLSSRPIVFDPDVLMLMPRDLNAGEQQQLRL